MLPARLTVRQKVAFLQVFLASAALAVGLLVGDATAGAGEASPAPAGAPRVLAVTFENDVNPVSADYL